MAEQEVEQTTATDGKTTPLMQQYGRVKAQYPDAILLFRVGDFYETFGEDAIKTAQILGIVLTSRNNGGSDLELAGFPYHSLDVYLPKLVKAGYRVAVCEQLEQPSKHKKIVKRGVTEMITPGIAIDDNILNTKENNYLCALFAGNKNTLATAFLDISTGEFIVAEGSVTYIQKLLQNFNPAEILLPKQKHNQFQRVFGGQWYTYLLDDWVFTFDYGREKLLKHFEVNTLKGFGIEDLAEGQIAAGAIIHYLINTENKQLQHIRSIRRWHEEEYLWLDRFTVRNLELLRSYHDGGVPLIDILDQTISPMGARLLRQWLIFPLRSIKNIQSRLTQTEYLYQHPAKRQQLEQQIRLIGDLERLVSKISVGKANPRDIQQLRKALTVLEPIKLELQQSGIDAYQRMSEGLQPCVSIREKIKLTIQEDPPVSILKGEVIASGINHELDDLRHVISHSKELLLEIQQIESKRTGIPNLKIGFNNVFGYYLEVTNKYKDVQSIPADWVRKQTLTNGERYISEELKKLEERILGAEEKIQTLEESIFSDLLQEIIEFIEPIQHNARLIAKLDCLCSFARIAEKNRYVKPILDESAVLEIRDGRHPVIEKQLPLGEAYVPNDVYLDNDHQQILMITGPNMSGKSAVLRQTAIICIMAQMGSFVPAAYARIGILDKIYTRVGASDNISSGESTFMVEMNETANILNNISDRSLVLLDEIGRGTSTYDGVSIAWSIAEYLHENPQARPKTLFATHYHELNELAAQFTRIKNYNVAVKEIGSKIIFLRKLVEGGSSHSFGIHVAKMAGMPQTIVERANQILHWLETQRTPDRQTPIKITAPREPLQLSIFDLPDDELVELKRALLDLDLSRLTPIECMLKLLEWQKKFNP